MQGLEAKCYRLNLYFEHFDNVYPLFNSESVGDNEEKQDVSPRLKLAMFAIAASLAKQSPIRVGLPSAENFAKLAESLVPGPISDIDEIKACFLLCVYHLSESLGDHALVEIGRLVRIARLWISRGVKDDKADRRSHSGQGPKERVLEERALVWWSILSLETSCNALL